MEFSYNNNYQSSIGMASYEALYGRRCRTPMYWTELDEHKIIGSDLVKDMEEKVRIIQQRLKATNDRQKSYANLKRKDIEFEVGDKVFLKASPWKKDTPLWKIRKTESKIHWPLPDFRKSWTNSISFGTPYGVSQIT